MLILKNCNDNKLYRKFIVYSSSKLGEKSEITQYNYSGKSKAKIDELTFFVLIANENLHKQRTKLHKSTIKHSRI
jgi:hypothetical protein